MAREIKKPRRKKGVAKSADTIWRFSCCGRNPRAAICDSNRPWDDCMRPESIVLKLYGGKLDGSRRVWRVRRSQARCNLMAPQAGTAPVEASEESMGASQFQYSQSVVPARDRSISLTISSLIRNF